VHPLDYLLDDRYALKTAHAGMDLDPLTTRQKSTFHTAVTLLKKANDDGKLLTTFRGDSYTRLAERVGGDHGWEGVLYQRTFYFGDKSKHFLENNASIAKRAHLRAIDDVSDATFEFLFKKIAKICQLDVYKGHLFLKDNVDIVRFFVTPENKEFFLSSIRNQPEGIKMLVRDYYLYLLHTAGKKGVSKESVLVSTSTHWMQARGFVDQLDTRQIIYYYFVPAPFERYCITSYICQNAYSVIERLSLPRYQPDSGLYPDQREVSMRGGLLPHFMLGILRVDLDEFVVNPHLLAMPEEDLQSIVVSGIKIDQAHFHDRIKETNYQRYSELRGDMFAAYMRER